MDRRKMKLFSILIAHMLASGSDELKRGPMVPSRLNIESGLSVDSQCNVPTSGRV